MFPKCYKEKRHQTSKRDGIFAAGSGRRAGIPYSGRHERQVS